MPEERRLVTVLFADVTGSTALGEELDPEDVRALMGRYYEHARRVVESHGGTLEKFIGDAVMAVFGLPHAHGDDAERAVAAAFGLQKAVEDDSVLKEMTLRIGVNTGEVVATSDKSSGDFLVTGDAVNVAARLQQCASPGEVLVSQRTYAATQAAFLYGDARAVEVKGKRDPVTVVPVMDVRPIRQVRRPPLVGRKRELAQLALLQSWALEEQRPQLVSMVAPAGTGKTRLLEEFLARLDPQEGWQVATGRCLPYGQTLTYWPLRGLLENLVGAISAEAVEAAILRGGYEPADARRLAGLVLATLGAEGAGQWEGTPERESIFNAWRLLVETLAHTAPRIVAFEDLHWAGDSLLDLVEHIMHPRTRAPLLMVATSRPELLDRRPTWGSGGRHSFTALALEPLNGAQTAQLVERLGPELPAGIRQRIVERSGGNPFFATELVRGLTEQGVALHERAETVPDTVHAAVLARLDGLAPGERAVVQAAAVAGRAFRPSTLQAVLEGADGQELDAALEGLLARDLIVPEEGGVFTFRHILIRDVAYGTLSRAERIRMHAAVAAWLEDFAADRLDEFAELIAYHYRETVTLARRSAVPLPLPIDPARAVYFLERAGELASRSGAWTEARHYLQSAIDIAPEDEHARLYERLGDCLPLGDFAADAYRKALERWRAEEPKYPLVGARLLRKILIAYLRWQSSVGTPARHGELVEMRAEAHRLARESGDEDEIWRVRVADLFWWERGIAPEDAEQSRAVGLAAAAYFEERENWVAFSEALDGYAALSLKIGAHRDAIHGVERRLRAPELPSLERGDIVGMLTRAHLQLGEYDRSIEVIRDALGRIRPGEPIAHLAYGTSMAAAAACLGGCWAELDELIGPLTEAWEQHQQQEPDAFVAMRGYFAMLHLACARDDRASADAAASVLERIVVPPGRGGSRALFDAYREDDPRKLDLDLAPDTSRATPHILTLALMFLAERGTRARANLVDAATALARAQKIDMLIRSVEITRALAAEDPERLAQAIDAAEQHGLIPHATRMRIVLAQLTNDPTPLKLARPVLERLGDRQFLRRLEEVAAACRA